MKQVIKITDIESGKELEIVKVFNFECDNCYYLEKCTSPISANDIPCVDACIIFKEVTKEENGKKN
jgi:hypothetical protein